MIEIEVKGSGWNYRAKVIIINFRKRPNKMGGGIAGWFTPGWIYHEPRLAPHIHKPDFVEKMIADAEDPIVNFGKTS